MRVTGRSLYSMCGVSASGAFDAGRVSVSHGTDGRPRGPGPEPQRTNAPLAVELSMIDAAASLRTICALPEILSDEWDAAPDAAKLRRRGLARAG